jgi:hypothetical protein
MTTMVRATNLMMSDFDCIVSFPLLMSIVQLMYIISFVRNPWLQPILQTGSLHRVAK